MVRDKEKCVCGLGNPAGPLLLHPHALVQEKEIIQQASTVRIKSSNLSGINYKSSVS